MEGPMLSTASISKRGNSLDVNHGDDSGLIVRFYMEAERQGKKSEEEGREIYKDVPYISIQFSGDRSREVARRVDMTGKRNGLSDPERFPRQWAAFQNQQEVVHEGTPLEEWAPCSKSMAMTYKGLNVHTVEQLASVADNILHNLGHGSRQMRDKAIAWLKSAEGSAELLKVSAENERLKEDMAMLKEQVASLKSKKASKKK